MSELENYKLIAQGLTDLFPGLVEVTIHEMGSNEIIFIAGELSKRIAGEASYLSETDKLLPIGIVGPYRKNNPDGKPLKSISVVLHPTKHYQRLMLCINFDVSKLQEMQSFLSLLTLQSDTKDQHHYFSENWQDQIHGYIHAELKLMNKTMDHLTRSDKKILIEKLRRHGAFSGKNAAAYIAKILNISRATVYGYLKNTGESDA